MRVNTAKGLIDDVRSKKLKRKKVCKKKNYKNLLEALDILSRELEISQKLNDMYLDRFNKIYLENQEHAEMLREYHRRSDPTLYPEETKEEAEVLDDLDDDDYDDLEREIYEESMRWEKSIKKESEPTTTITARDAFEWLCSGLRHCTFDSEEQRKRIDDIVGEFAAVFEEKEENFSELSKELKELLGENYVSASDAINMFKENPNSVDKDTTEESSNE